MDFVEAIIGDVTSRGQGLAGAAAGYQDQGHQYQVEEEEHRVPPPPVFQNIPCLACGSNCFIKSEEESGGMTTFPPDTNSLEGNECLVKFCQLLKIKINPKFNWEEGSELIPICTHCKGQLILLSDLKRKLEELERDFRNGIREFRKLCEEAEGTFKNSGIYGKDQRYFKVRKQIVKMTSGSEVQPISRPKRAKTDEMVERTEVPPLKLKSYALPYVRRPQRSKSIRTKSICALAKYSPVVAVSSEEKERAEQFKIVKTELVERTQIEDEGFDGFHMGLSPSPQMGIDDDKDPLEEEEDDDWTPSDLGLKKEDRQQRKKSKSKPLPKKTINQKATKKENSKRASSSPRNPPRRRKLDRLEATSRDEDLHSDFEEDNSNSEDVRMEEEDSDFELDPTAKALLHSSDPENSEEEDAVWDALYGKRRKTVLDPQTGLYSVIHVKFRPISEAPKILECLECHEKVSSITAMRSHAFKVHTTRFKCSVSGCGRLFGNRHALRLHSRNMHQRVKKKRQVSIRKRKDCSICGKPCKSAFILRYHVFTHYSEEDKAEALARGETLLNWKDKERSVQCEICGGSFSAKYTLNQHMRRKHPTPEDPEASKELCPECGKLVDKSHMAKHRLRSHNIGPDGKLLDEESAKRFICSVCDKRFVDNIGLRKHKLAVHDKARPFKCDRCPRSFTFKIGLDKHINNAHNNIRNFQCAHCPMAFFSGYHLKRHIGIYHEGGGNPRRKSYVRGATTGNKKSTAAPPPHHHPASIPNSESSEGSNSNHNQFSSGAGATSGVPPSSITLSRHFQLPDPSIRMSSSSNAELIERFMQFQSQNQSGISLNK